MKLTILPVLLALSTVRAVRAACTADNCYRAFWQAGNPTATEENIRFCDSLGASPPIPSGQTGTTAVVTNAPYKPPPPSRATLYCGQDLQKYSSLCSCTLYTPTPVTSAYPTASGCPYQYTDFTRINNGGFECPDYYPWEVQLTPSARYKLSSPGSKGSKTAFEFSLAAQTTRFSGSAIARIFQFVELAQGAQYRLTFDTYISSPYPGRSNAGFWGVQIGEGCYSDGKTIDANEGLGQRVWNSQTLDFTSKATAELRRFNFVFEAVTSEVGAVFKIDNVVLTKL